MKIYEAGRQRSGMQRRYQEDRETVGEWVIFDIFEKYVRQTEKTSDSGGQTCKLTGQQACRVCIEDVIAIRDRQSCRQRDRQLPCELNAERQLTDRQTLAIWHGQTFRKTS
jgi:hypothetical protein